MYFCYLKRFLLFASLFFTWEINLYSQTENYYIKNYNLKDGLYNNHIRSITQDSSGFLWIATWDGLSRFDGYEFKNYYQVPDDSTSLPDIDLRKVCVDRYNNVWLSALYSLCKYDRENDIFIKCNNQSVKYKTVSSSFSAIATDHYGNLWALGNKGFEIYDDNSHFLNCRLLNYDGKLIKCDTIYSFTFDDYGNIWIFNRNNLYKCNYFKSHNGSDFFIKVVNKFDIVIPKGKDSNFYPQIFRIFYNNSKNNIWLTSNLGLFCIDIKGGTTKRYYDNIPVDEFNKNNSKIIWSSKEEGLVIYSPDKNSYYKKKVEDLCIPETYFIDKQDLIWTGGLLSSGEGAGLFMLAKTTNLFSYYLDNIKEKNKLTVTCVFKDKKKNIWVGTRNYNYLIKVLPDGKTQKLNYIDNNKFPLAYPKSFLDDNNGNLWIGYFRNLLYRYNYADNNFTEYYPSESFNRESAYMEGFRLLLNDKNKNIFAGSENYYCCFNPTNNHVLFKGEKIDGNILSLCIDRDSNYWIGSNNILFFIDKKKYKLKSFYEFENISNNIECITEGDSSCFWFALLGGGLCKFDKNTKTIHLFTTKDGLSHNTTYNILKDRKGNLWISTNKGISMFNPKTNQFRNFGQDDGLKIEEFNAGAAYQTIEGEMIYGGMGGVVSFFPDSLTEKQDNYNAPLLFTELKSSGERYVLKNIYDLKNIELAKGSDNFEISFSCSDYRNADKIQYRYYLKGYNEDWIITDHKHRYVNYASLNPGKYNFILEATDISGNWARKNSLEIIIPAYYYQQKWFWAIIIFLIITGTAVIIKLRFKNIHLAERKKQEQLKLEILRSQLNPHFIDNCLNSVNSMVSVNDEKNVNQYLSDFSRLMRLFLNNSNKEYIPFKDELESIYKYLQLEYSNNSDKFEYEIVVDELLNIDGTQVTPSLIQPFIENVIKHAFPEQINRKGKIRIEFNYNRSEAIICTISDDGIGRELSQKNKTEFQKQRKSKGESLVKERLTFFNSINKTNYKIETSNLYNDRIETGTKIIIEIPIKVKSGK